MKQQQGRPRRGGGRRERPEYDQKLLSLDRVTRVVKGGRRFRFRATLVIGNRKGKVGVGVAKGNDVSDAIQKAFNDAKKHLVSVSLVGGTIAHDVYAKEGSAKVLLKPAKAGRGLIAGGAVRAVADLLGVKDIVSKSLGSSNALNLSRATVRAFSQLKNEASVQKEETAPKAGENQQ
ncbi:MAG: 30S ribosomal protein S5 [Candidatus Moranbacteria bacterium]|nr:30S ribosomal protein S5 [Candidatus Moranbacteria bacterium]NTW46153.1 30S ribosomal protein S5 [Candidatus Moranbacteria bacterium]